MTIEYMKNQAIFKDVVRVDEAEGLLEWLQKKTAAKIDLSACTHLHSANLQVLMAAKTNVTAWPINAEFADWLRLALVNH